VKGTGNDAAFRVRSGRLGSDCSSSVPGRRVSDGLTRRRKRSEAFSAWMWSRRLPLERRNRLMEVREPPVMMLVP
jgi:hypothetical protein